MTPTIVPQMYVGLRPRRGYRRGMEPDDLYGLPLEQFTAARTPRR
jgi:hypothetical protein